MVFRIEVLELAQQDFDEAYYWYEQQRRGLGDDLSLCYYECLEVLSRGPFFEIRYDDLRVIKIRRFPYQIVYRIENDVIKIVAFFHAHRNPSIWKIRGDNS